MSSAITYARRPQEKKTEWLYWREADQVRHQTIDGSTVGYWERQ